MSIRVATFNCENLFSRPKIFGARWKRSLELLDHVSKLHAELNRDVFDQKKIKELKEKLKGYVKINDVRGKHSKTKGVADWSGWIELTRKPADDTAIENTARVIKDVDADIICLIEVENRIVLQEFHDQILYKQFLKPSRKKPYEHILLIDGNDSRGIDVSIMSRLPIDWISTHIHEKMNYLGKKVNTFSRDCLEAMALLKNGTCLYLLVNHLKSMGYSPPNDPQSNKRRRGQAKRVNEIASEYDLKKDYVVVAGDLNTDPINKSLEPLLKNPDLYNVNEELPVDERGTYRTGKKQLDYVMVSKSLKRKLTRVLIERRGIFSKKIGHYASVTGRRTEASDHAAVVAEFAL